MDDYACIDEAFLHLRLHVHRVLSEALPWYKFFESCSQLYPPFSKNKFLPSLQGIQYLSSICERAASEMIFTDKNPPFYICMYAKDLLSVLPLIDHTHDDHISSRSQGWVSK